MFLLPVIPYETIRGIPHNVGMFLSAKSDPLSLVCISHNVGMFLYCVKSCTLIVSIPYNVGMFLEVKLLILQREYSPQRGDVSAEGEQKAQLEKYSPQRGDVSN